MNIIAVRRKKTLRPCSSYSQTDITAVEAVEAVYGLFLKSTLLTSSNVHLHWVANPASEVLGSLGEQLLHTEITWLPLLSLV